MRIGKNTPWLVKSSGRILGPYFEKEIVSLLRTREIVLIDEVSRPCGRWIYIRDEPCFAAIAEELRQKNMRTMNDDTTTRINESSITDSQTLSLTQDLDHLDDRTEEISRAVIMVDRSEKPIQTIQDIIQPKRQNTTSAPASDDTYVFEGDALVQRETQSVAKYLWAMTVIVIFSTVGYVAFRQYVSKPIQNRTIIRESLEKAEFAMEDGDYESALSLYKKAHTADPKDSRTYLPLAVLSIQLEKQTVTARRLLENLLSTQERDRQRILTAIGFADIVDGRYTEGETRFNRALDVDPLFKPALINLGASSLESNDPEKANNYLQIAIKDGSREGIEQLMVVEALIRLYEKEKEKTYLRDADRFIREYIAQKRGLHQEALVASIYIDHLLGDRERIYASINQFLDFDPEFSDDHKYNPYIFRGRIEWTKLNQWCLKAGDGLDPVARVVAFEAICLLKANELRDASTKIEDAIQQAPRDPLVQAAYGQIMMATNAEERARSAFEKSLDFDRERNFKVPRILMARWCQQAGQTDCAEAQWKEALALDRNSLPALAGLIKVAMTKKRPTEARGYLEQGLAVAPNYRPFLNFKRKAMK